MRFTDYRDFRTPNKFLWGIYCFTFISLFSRSKSEKMSPSANLLVTKERSCNKYACRPLACRPTTAQYMVPPIPKRISKYSDDWTSKYRACIQKGRVDKQHSAYCIMCKKEFCIGKMGQSAIVKHPGWC